jgi:hypothetical protein
MGTCSYATDCISVPSGMNSGMCQLRIYEMNPECIHDIVRKIDKVYLIYCFIIIR